ncbi:unnamed protein product, partial [Prorocentrum cordatum]
EALAASAALLLAAWAGCRVSGGRRRRAKELCIAAAAPGLACRAGPLAERRGASVIEGLGGGALLHARYGDTAGFVLRLARLHAVSLDDSDLPPLGASERQKITTALESVREAVAGIPAHEGTEPFDDPCIGRLLVAADFDVARAVQLANSYAAFRRGVFLLLCEDRRGRPVLLVRVKYVDKEMSVPALQLQFRAYMDAISLHMLLRRPELAATNTLEQYVCVIDAADAGLANCSMGFFRMLLEETSTHYPERVQEVVVLGVNATVRMIWSTASGLAHPRTRKKLKMIPPGDLTTFMRGLVAEEGLPADYGGRAPALEDPNLLGEGVSARHVGALASAIWERQSSLQKPDAPSPATDECCEGSSFSSRSSFGSPAPLRRRPSTQTAGAWRGSCMGSIFESFVGTCNPCVAPRSPGPPCQGQRPGRMPVDALGEPHRCGPVAKTVTH